MKLRNVVAGVAAVMFLGASSLFAASVGAAAPSFTLTDINGDSHSLSDYAGKVVVLEWTNYGCPFVKKHYNSGNMQELQKVAKGKEVVWLSICSSAPGTQGNLSLAEWKAEFESKGVNAATVLLDETGKVGRLYGAIATPQMFVINGSGELVYDGAIDSIASTKQSDIAKAENYVLAALDAVFAGKPVEKSKNKPYGCGVKYAN